MSVVVNFAFHSEILDPEFRAVNVSVWSENSSGEDKAVGNINIPGSFLQKCKGNSIVDELWFPLLPPALDLDISGELKLKILYSEDGNNHNFRVTGTYQA